MKVLIITGDDYAALQFENAFRGTSVKIIIENSSDYTVPEDDGENFWEIEVKDVGEVNKEFLKFVRNFIDEENRKHQDFYMEDEII